MNKTLHGMAIAYWTAAGLPRDEFTVDGDDISRLKACLIWLADNVSDEMVRAFSDKWTSSRGDATAAIAAALRAAGDGR